MQTIKLKIEGMTCNHCVMRVKKALESCSGVASAEVIFESASAKATGEGMFIEELIRCVEAAGYSAHEITNNN